MKNQYFALYEKGKLIWLAYLPEPPKDLREDIVVTTVDEKEFSTLSKKLSGKIYRV